MPLAHLSKQHPVVDFLKMYIYTGARIKFIGNAAERGGGLSLEANAKFYILTVYDIMMMIMTLIQQYSLPTVQTMVEQYMWMMTPTLVRVRATQRQNASFKYLLSIVIYLHALGYRVCSSHKTMLKFLAPLSMEDY